MKKAIPSAPLMSWSIGLGALAVVGGVCTWLILLLVGAGNSTVFTRWEDWVLLSLVYLILVATTFGLGYFWKARNKALEAERDEIKRTAAKLAERHSVLESLCGEAHLLVRLGDAALLEANPKACQTLGYSLADLRDHGLTGLLGQGDVAALLRAGGDPASDFGSFVRALIRTGEGKTREFELKPRQVTLDGEILLHVSLRDMTAQRGREHQLGSLERLQATQLLLQETMLRASSQVELFDEVCSILADHPGFVLAWIGSLEPGTGRLAPLVAKGAAADLVSRLDIRVGGEGARFSSPAHVALREGRADLCQNLEDARMSPWRNMLRECGIQACGAFPVHREKRIWGCLSVYASSANQLGEREREVLEMAVEALSRHLTLIDEKASHARIEEALRSSEDRFRTLFHAVSEVISLHELVCDQDGRHCDYRFTDCNAAFSRVMGIPRERVIGSLASELFGTGHAPYLTEFSSVAITGEPYSFETYFAPLDRYLLISVVAPAPGHFATVTTDITQRKQTELALRDSEARFRATFEQAATGIAHSALDGRFLRVNSKLCELFGHDAEALLQMRFQDFTFAEDVATDLAGLQSLVEGRSKVYSREKRYLIHSGGTLWAQVTVSLVRLPNGEPHYFIAVIQDVAQRKQAEDALRGSEARFRRLTLAITDYVFSVQMRDGQPAGTRHGAGCLAVTGYTEAEFEADTFLWLRMVVSEDRHVVLDQVEAILANRDPQPIEHRIIRKDGTIRWVRNTPSPCRNSQGMLLSYDGLVQDITDRKNAEIQLIEANAKLQTYATQMETLVRGRTAELEATNRELEAFTYSVSHDLRAPLRAIDGFAKILLEDYGLVLDEEGKRLLRVVGGECQHLGRLIDDLLALSRMGRQALNPVAVDMTTLVDEVRSELVVREPDRRIQWRVGFLPGVVGDPVFLRQVLLNLLGNAMKYTRKREVADIAIDGTIRGVEAEFSIKDNGAGFDMKHVGRLFGVFQRLHSDKEFEGNGVGLAIVQRILQRHGGRIWAEGEAGRGAVFHFTLPIVSIHQDQ